MRRGGIRVRSEAAKNGDERFIPLNPELHDLLRAHNTEAALQGKQPPSRVFTTRNGTNTYQNLLTEFYRCLWKPKVHPEGVDIHALRAAWISYEIDAGRNPRHVQYVAGHRTFSMTMDTYYKVQREALLECHTRLPYFHSKPEQDNQNESAAKTEDVVPRVVPQAGKTAG